MIKLVEVLVSDDQPHLIFPRLIKQIFQTVVKIIMGLIHIHKGCAAFVLRDDCPLLCCLADQGDKKPTQDLTTILLEQILYTDQN